jgi:Domain of unknown function (DUF6265)
MKILLTILLLSTGVFAQNALEKVSWLTGCWGGVVDGGKYEECWTSPSKNFMQGAGSLVKGDKILMREFMTIEKDGDDIVMYILGYGEKLQPEEQGTIPFKLTKSSKMELVFENPKHDYPQRIVYTKDKKGDIVARIELIDGTKPMKFAMNNLMKKTK